MKHENKLTHKEQSQLETQQQQTQSPSVQEFATPEDLLRHDALHTPVPPTVAHRLKESISHMPESSHPWWKRLLGS
jgi:hypothetical protein